MLLSIFISGCITDFEMNLDDAKQHLVVDGLITSQAGPYYVRLVKSKVSIINNNEPENRYIDYAEAIKGALLIISDDFGQMDTLRPVVYNPDKEFLTYERGYYQTNTLKGIPGHTYYLKIRAENKEYSAECFMPPVTPIDSANYIIEKGEIGKNDYLIPLIYFKEPQNEKNYYLINYYTSKNFVDEGFVDNFLWQYFILSDEYLEPYVKALRVENGASPRDLGNYSIFYNDVVKIRLMSLTAEAYSYYKILLDQFEYDGGTYKPTPASPTTNINSGALGFFRASAISEKTIKMPDYNYD